MGKIVWNPYCVDPEPIWSLDLVTYRVIESYPSYEENPTDIMCP